MCRVMILAMAYLRLKLKIIVKKFGFVVYLDYGTKILILTNFSVV